MAQVVLSLVRAPTTPNNPTKTAAFTRPSTHCWTSSQRRLKPTAKFTCNCLFSDNRKQEQARKALEGALGGKKTEFEKWDKEIKKREESDEGGGNSGKGGWFGWFNWFRDENFWPEAQTAGLTILAILALYLVVAKGDVLIAVVFNPLLFALRGTRTAFTFCMSKIMDTIYPAGHTYNTPQPEVATATVSAKDRVLGKWGSN